MLEFGEKVVGGRYQIASMPYDEKSDVYDEIRNYWQGTGATGYYEKSEDAWYIVIPA